MKKIIFWSIVMIMSSVTYSLFSYNISSDDELLLEQVENKITTSIDENNNITAEKVVTYIKKILSTGELTDRQKMLLEIISDDVSWMYYTGVYQYDILTAQDCYEDEYFDAEAQKCYFDEKNFDSEAENNLLNDDTTFERQEGQEKQQDIIGLYSISGDDISLTQGQDRQESQIVWKIFSTIIPSNLRPDIISFGVYDDSTSDTAAFVVQDENDSTKWSLTVNLDSMYDETGKIGGNEANATLIHEFAHILTLGKSQVRYYPRSDNEKILQRFEKECTTNLLQEGCLLETAYLDDFIDIFWSNPAELKKVREEQLDVYAGNESKFITDYAASGPEEDIAESFAYYVMRAETTGNSIADKKLQFFENYSELKSLRKQILYRLTTIQ